MKMKYTLSRKNENSLFGPIITEEYPEGEWPDVFHMIGPNTIGKSTMLNILGISCDGNNNEKIHSSIREKMIHLMDEEYHQLEFRIELESRDGDLILILEKSANNPKIKIAQIINGGSLKELSIEDFRRDIVLIYDTPIDPIKRAQDLKNEFGEVQRNILTRILRYKAYIKQIMTDADNKRIDKINEKTIELQNKEKRITDLSKKIELSQCRLRLLECATYFRYQDYYKSQKESIEKDKEVLKHEIDLLGGNLKSTDKKLRTTHNEVINKILSLRTNYDSIAVQLRVLMPDDSYNLDNWEKIDFEKMKDGYTVDKEFSRLIIHFISAIDKMKKDNKDDIQELKACKDLQGLCGTYRELDMCILGTTSSFADGLQWANQELDKRKKIRANMEIMEKCSQKLGVMKIDLEELRRLLQKVEIMDKDALIKKDNSSLIESKQEDWDKCDKLCNSYNDKYKKYASLIVTDNVSPDKNCKIGEGELEEYKGSSEDGLMDAIYQFKDSISDNEKMLEDENDRRTKMKLEIEKLKTISEVPYEKHVKELDKFFKATESLQRKFGQEFKDYIDNIDKYRDHKIDMTNFSEEQKIYYNSLFSYLAKMIRKIRHMGEYIEVIDINLIRNTFTSKDGIVRNFLDLGAGENQLNYLIGILEPKDNRKMIVLLDDMANIDFKNMTILKEKLRRLRDEDRLLFGIIVQARQSEGPLEIYKI